MSIFSKLFKKAAPETEREFVARAPRVKLLSLHGVSFRDESGVTHELANLSTTGAGFLRGGHRSWPEADRLRGELIFEKQAFPVELIVAHRLELIGARFEGEYPELRRKIQEYFKLEILALQMTAVPEDVLQTQADGKPRWFHGRNNCELYFVTAPSGELVRFHLAFFANYIEGSPDAPARYGQVVEEKTFEKPKHKGSAGVRWQERFPPELMELIRKFVSNIPELGAGPRERILELISAEQAKPVMMR